MCRSNSPSFSLGLAVGGRVRLSRFAARPLAAGELHVRRHSCFSPAVYGTRAGHPSAQNFSLRHPEQGRRGLSFTVEGAAASRPSRHPISGMSSLARHSDPSVTFLHEWERLPGVSLWVLRTIRTGYTLQFGRNPPRFDGKFKMLTMRTIMSQVQEGDWFVTIDLKDAYFHIQVVQRHRRFLRFAFGGKAYQYMVLPFGLALAPRTFTKCMDAALAPLRLQGIRVLNYLDDWLILAHSRELVSRHRDIVLGHIHSLGLRMNAKKNVLLPSQRTVFLGVRLDSVQMQARLAPARIPVFTACLARFKLGHHVSVGTCRRLLGLMAAASPVLPLGLLHMRPFLWYFLPVLGGHHIIVRTDNMAVVSHINRQGGSKRIRSGGTYCPSFKARSGILSRSSGSCGYGPYRAKGCD